MSGLDPRRPTDPPFVPWTFAEHDDAVRELVRAAHEHAAWTSLPRGVGVIDFADGTVVVLSKIIPPGETFTTDRRTENHIRAGMGSDPFAGYQSTGDFTDQLVEIKNPDAKNTLFGVNGTRDG